jgi:hypothetical protein
MSKPKQALRWSRGVAVGSLSALALFGCASIIGLDDYTVAGNAGQGGSTGGTSSAGRAGAVSGGSAGEAGSSASGEGGEGGEGDEGGEGGESPTCGVTSFVPNENVIRSCILRAGCSPYTKLGRTISTCVTYDTQAALPGENCNINSTTCKEYEDCEHVGVAQDDLCGGTKGTRCENNLAINCGNYDINQFYDCTALGGTCATYAFSDTNHTLYADCKLDIPADSCAGVTTDTLEFCHSAVGEVDTRYYCYEGQAYGAQCELGYCADDATPGKASCYFTLPKCTGSTVPTCKNNVANVCSSGGLFKYDCGAMGLTCGVTEGTEYCFAPGCNAADVDTNCTESCSDDGSQLTFCYGGAPYTVKCSDYGFSQCVSDTDPDNDDKPYASCRF